jgi:hypothetical protein
MAENLRILDDGHRAAAAANDTAGVPALPSSQGLSLASLLDLSRELRSVLVMAQPRAEFREALYGQLLVEARRQQALRMLSLSIGSTPSYGESPTTVQRAHLGYGSGGRRWIIGAAAVGSAASVVGLLAYVRSRRQGKAA